MSRKQAIHLCMIGLAQFKFDFFKLTEILGLRGPLAPDFVLATFWFLKRTCLVIPTSNSSTLCLKITEVSINLDPDDVAFSFPSKNVKYKLDNLLIYNKIKITPARISDCFF